MQALTLAMLVVVTTFEFLAKGDNWGRWSILPGFAQYFPELFGVIGATIVLLSGTTTRFRLVNAQYWLIFGALLLAVVCGLVVNNVEAGPMFAGIRTYARAVPWFFVPAVIAFTDKQIKTQLKVLMCVGLAQVPLAIQQRWTLAHEGRFTGDYVTGTLLISSIMSIFLIGAMCIAAAMFVRGELKRWQFVFLFLFLLLPTTINETKGTLILLPICLLVSFLVASRPGHRLKVILLASTLIITFVAVYFPVYEHFYMERRYAEPLLDRLSNPEKLKDYLWKTEDIGSDVNPGRIDSIVVPIKRMAHDPAYLAFGFGMGNVSRSALGREFIGDYYPAYGSLLTTSVGRVLLELGLLSVFLVLLLMWLIYRDSLAVSRQRAGFGSTLSAGWAGVVVLMGLAMFYKDVIAHVSLSFVFWYFAGVVASARMRLALDSSIHPGTLQDDPAIQRSR
jgi:hypothetical protein